jgi:hypothetical protein
VQQPTENAPLSGYVQRLEQVIVEPFHSRGKKLYEEAVDAGKGYTKTMELVPAQRQ